MTPSDWLYHGLGITTEKQTKREALDYNQSKQHKTSSLTIEQSRLSRLLTSVVGLLDRENAGDQRSS